MKESENRLEYQITRWPEQAPIIMIMYIIFSLHGHPPPLACPNISPHPERDTWLGGLAHPPSRKTRRRLEKKLEQMIISIWERERERERVTCLG